MVGKGRASRGMFSHKDEVWETTMRQSVLRRPSFRAMRCYGLAVFDVDKAI